MQQGHLYNIGLVRSLFEKAADCVKSKFTPAIWHYYIMFEINQKDYVKAKALVFRAVKECPWAKSLYLFAMIELFKVFTDVEIEQFSLLMEENEVRMRNLFPPIVE